ncbi:hypothetical protein K7X08_034560 [Anisodus acutangulus]|uniref:Ubiquitin-like protease family profile domain-containing protein n=1 Tax=Anisodus acutangulus TaxID=402998 RepID=A0A9Q1R112_9SOLA|nr:hypothetical protein K7X08_034560 [Anisodus acutangulus]
MELRGVRQKKIVHQKLSEAVEELEPVKEQPILAMVLKVVRISNKQKDLYALDVFFESYIYINHPAYADKSQMENLDVVFVDNLPQQNSGSMDCWVYVTAFAEYLSSGKAIPDEFNVKLLRMRYGALLWDYAARKIDVNAMSDSEVPQKPVRLVIDFDKVETINV